MVFCFFTKAFLVHFHSKVDDSVCLGIFLQYYYNNNIVVIQEEAWCSVICLHCKWFPRIQWGRLYESVKYIMLAWTRYIIVSSTDILYFAHTVTHWSCDAVTSLLDCKHSQWTLKRQKEERSQNVNTLDIRMSLKQCKTVILKLGLNDMASVAGSIPTCMQHRFHLHFLRWFKRLNFKNKHILIF